MIETQKAAEVIAFRFGLDVKSVLYCLEHIKCTAK